MFAVKSNYPAQRTRLEHFTRAFQHFKRVKLKWAWVYVQEPLFVTYIYGELRGSLQSAELNIKLANDKKKAITILRKIGKRKSQVGVMKLTWDGLNHSSSCKGFLLTL